MADTTAQRDSNGEGYCAGEGISLGARRLSIIDLPGRNQPIWNGNRGVVTVFNGEIHNYRALLALLEKNGTCFDTAGQPGRRCHDMGAGGARLLLPDAYEMSVST